MTKITIKVVIDLVAMDFMINLCNFLLFISPHRQQQKNLNLKTCTSQRNDQN